jgi:hypothetical protein
MLEIGPVLGFAMQRQGMGFCGLLPRVADRKAWQKQNEQPEQNKGSHEISGFR